jgi:hypothetical protein
VAQRTEDLAEPTEVPCPYLTAGVRRSQAYRWKSVEGSKLQKFEFWSKYIGARGVILSSVRRARAGGVVTGVGVAAGQSIRREGGHLWPYVRKPPAPFGTGGQC